MAGLYVFSISKLAKPVHCPKWETPDRPDSGILGRPIQAGPRASGAGPAGHSESGGGLLLRCGFLTRDFFCAGFFLRRRIGFRFEGIEQAILRVLRANHVLDS